MNKGAMKFIVSAIEPTVRQMHRKFSNVLSWEFQDFMQEAYLKVCEPMQLPDAAGPVISFFAKTYKNHILDKVRKTRSQQRISNEYKSSGQHLPPWYDDTKALQLSYMIENELPQECRDIVLMLLDGKTSRFIMDKFPAVGNRFSYYKALNRIRDEVKRFYVVDAD